MEIFADLSFFALGDISLNGLVHSGASTTGFAVLDILLTSTTFVSGTPITKLPKTLSPERDTTLKYRFSRGISECWLKTANFATC